MARPLSWAVHAPAIWFALSAVALSAPVVPVRAQRVDVTFAVVAARRSKTEGAAGVGDTLMFADVVRRALIDGPDVLVSALAVQVARGNALSAEGVFDTRLQASALNDRTNNLSYVESLTSAVATSEAYTAGAQKRLRQSGIILSPQLGVTRLGTPGTPVAAQSRALVALAATVPLLRDRGGALARAPAEIATLELRAAEADLGYSAANGVYQTINAYWSFVAARRQLIVYQATEARALQMLTRTTALVNADERPPADLTQLRGSYALKRAQTIAAEQSVVETWLQLAQRLALPPASIATPPTTMSDFPPVGSDLSERNAQAVLPRARAERQDLRAAVARSMAARRGVVAAAALMRSQVDVVTQIGYTGLERGSGLNPLVQPFYRNRSGLNASVQLQFSRPYANSDARGQAAAADASLESTQLAEREADRRVAMGVAVATAAVRYSGRVVIETQRALAIVREAVVNEQRRFQLGTSTAFDIIIAEDNLASAALAEVSAQQAYATALGRFHNEAGTLVRSEARVLSAEPSRLLLMPNAP